MKPGVLAADQQDIATDLVAVPAEAALEILLVASEAVTD